MIADLDTTHAPATTAQISPINLGKLHASPTNPRKHFDPAGIEELGKSIEEHGVQMPLLARPSKIEAGKFEIVAGERRFRASTWLAQDLTERINRGGEEFTPPEEAARLSELFAQRIDVPVIIKDLDDATVLELQLIENLQRRDLTPLEEARGYQNLLDLKEKEYTPKLIAQKISKSIDTVLNKLKMLRAPKVLLDALEQGKVSERHLVMVAGIPGEKARVECAKQVLHGDWQSTPLSVRGTLMLINEHYRQSLKGAPWSLEDATLVPDAGPCATCPHFARHAATQDSELAAELGNERGQTDPLTCMNPACFKQKQDALWKQREAQSKEGKVTVLKPKEAEKIISDYGSLHHGSSWVKLDDKLDYEILGHYDTKKSPSWRDVVEGRLPDGEVHVVNTKHAGIIELVPKKVAIEAGKAHKKHGKLFEKLKASGKKELTASEKKKKEKEAFDNKVLKTAKICQLQHLYERALEKGMDAAAGLAVLDTALYEAGMDGCRLICEWLNLEPTAKRKNQQTFDQENYREAVLKHLREKDAGKPEIDAMIMIAQVAKWVKNWGLKFSSLVPLQKYFGFDDKTILALATNEVQAEIDAKEAKKKPAKPEKAAGKNSTDPSNVSVAKEASKTKAADKRAKKGLSPEVREKILAAQQKRWAKTAAKSSVRGASANQEDYSKAADKLNKQLRVMGDKREFASKVLGPGAFGKGPARMAEEPDPRHETGYYHCDACGGVCAVGPDLVPDIEALKVGEFKCSECAEGRIFGTQFELVGNQEDYETWVPPAEPKTGLRAAAKEAQDCGDTSLFGLPPSDEADDDADFNDAE